MVHNPLFYKAPILLFKIPPSKIFFPSLFSLHPLLRHSIQFQPPPALTANSPTLSNTKTFPKPSYWRYLFPATNHNHFKLWSNKPKLNPILHEEGKFFPAKMFLLILKNYGRLPPAAVFQGTKFSFEGFRKISGQ